MANRFQGSPTRALLEQVRGDPGDALHFLWVIFLLIYLGSNCAHVAPP